MTLPLPAAVLLAALLAGCAAPGAGIAPGSPVGAVTQRMGAPTGEYALPGGGRRLEYASGPFGRRTQMFDFDAAGQLVRAEQVLTEANFNAIRAGMNSGEVLTRIGKPAKVWAIPRQRQTVWSYRYESPFCQWFMVGLDPQGVVMDTSYGPDPLCDDDDFFDRFRMRLR